MSSTVRMPGRSANFWAANFWKKKQHWAPFLSPASPATSGCTAVSYTHLDVYKRQLEKLAELASDTSAPKSSARSAPEL